MEKHLFNNIRVPIEKDNPSIERNEDRCMSCGACKNICKFNVGVYGYYDLDKTNNTAVCINCGSCSTVCPTRSIVIKQEKINLDKLKDKVLVAITAPAVRVALGDEFGYEVGSNTYKKMVSVLRKLGFNYVFDTTSAADLTVMEEAYELVDRIKNNKKLPMFTSCCPSWVKFVETFYPEYIDNLSTCKSPLLMQGAIIKNYFSEFNNIKKEDIVVVAITPCVAKKAERLLTNDVDYVITTTELANLIRKKEIDFNTLDDDEYDEMMPIGSGAGQIFGASGGVMEASLRCVYNILTNKDPNKKLLEFNEVRGVSNVKEATITINDRTFRLAVINGTGDARKVLDKLKNKEVEYDFIEVMACEGGCIAGAGQPRIHFPITNDIKMARINSLYNNDNDSKIRCSYKNPKIIKLYEDYLEKPLSKKSRELLHTKYVNRSYDLEFIDKINKTN